MSRELLKNSRVKRGTVETSVGTIHLTGMNLASRARSGTYFKDNETQHMVAAFGICNESGALEYDVDNEADVEELRLIHPTDMMKILEKIIELSNMTKESLDESEKKSEASQSA